MRNRSTKLLPLIALLPFFAVSSSFSQEKAGSSPSSISRLPDVTVSEPPALKEEQPVGENNQPQWTLERRFATSRVYVNAPWQVEFEQWWRGNFPRHGKADYLMQEEIGIGLPYRFQVDMYVNHEITSQGTWRYQGFQPELRWAFAEWGKIPLNPTIYAEWKENDHDPDVYEIKLLLGETIAPRWHWAMNFIYEQEVSGSRATELGVTQGISYTVLDQKLAVGAEMKFAHVTEKGSRSQPEIELLMGPSVQWRPTPRTHFDLVPLIGITDDSRRVEAYAVFGIDFGPGRDRKPSGAPVSSRSN